MHDACPGAEGSDRDPRIWNLPPTVPFNVLAPRLEGYLQRLVAGDESSDREQARSVNRTYGHFPEVTFVAASQSPPRRVAVGKDRWEIVYHKICSVCNTDPIREGFVESSASDSIWCEGDSKMM